MGPTACSLLRAWPRGGCSKPALCTFTSHTQSQSQVLSDASALERSQLEEGGEMGQDAA